MDAMIEMQDYQTIFDQMDIKAAFFKLILNEKNEVKDIIIESCNQQYIKDAREGKQEYHPVLHESYYELEPNHDPRWDYYLYQAAILKKHVHGEFRNQERNFWLEFSGGPLNHDGYCWMTFVDHTKYHDESEALRSLSYFDSLTGVKNRNAYEQMVTYLKKHKIYLGVIMSDINGLKELNDQKGHEAGDTLIVKTAHLLSEFANNDLPYRVGGDEFIILLINFSKEETKYVYQDLMAKNKLPLSIGYSWTKDSSLILETVKKADRDMYEAKRKYYQTHKRVHVD